MRLSAKITGPEKLRDHLLGLPDRAKAPLIRALKDGALAIHREAVTSIQEHRSQGIRYGKHVASAPGNPPNTDTGRLVSSIKWQIDEQAPAAAVGTDLDYGVGLEFGTARTSARPWLGPAYEKNKQQILKNIQNSLREMFRKR